MDILRDCINSVHSADPAVGIRHLPFLPVNNPPIRCHRKGMQRDKARILPLVEEQQQEDLLPDHDLAGCGVFDRRVH